MDASELTTAIEQLIDAKLAERATTEGTLDQEAAGDEVTSSRSALTDTISDLLRYVYRQARP